MKKTWLSFNFSSFSINCLSCANTFKAAFWIRLMRTGRAPRWRGIVVSFTGPADTRYNNAKRSSSSSSTTRLLALMTPRSSFALSVRRLLNGTVGFRAAPVPAVLTVLCAELIGVPPREDKCILFHFGKRPYDNSSTFWVCSVIYLHIPVLLLHIPKWCLSYSYL